MDVTGRAIIWCGQIRPNSPLDPVAFRNDIEIAHRAAVRRGVDPREIQALVCDDALLPEEFSGQWHSPDLASLDRVTRALARTSTSQDGLLFIATNHCGYDGLLTEIEPPDEFADDEPDPAYIHPASLQAYLDRIAGQQVVLVATCHAGMFLSLANERRLVLASCGNETDYTHTETHPPRSLFLSEVLSHWAGTVLGDYPEPEACPLLEAVERARTSCSRGRFEGKVSWPFEIAE